MLLRYNKRKWKYKQRDRSVYNEKFNSRRIYFLGKRIVLTWSPRNGFCSDCGYIGKTDMHHWFYLPCMPWACAKELCESCHDMTKDLTNFTMLGKHHSDQYKKHMSEKMKVIRRGRANCWLL